MHWDLFTILCMKYRKTNKVMCHFLKIFLCLSCRACHGEQCYFTLKADSFTYNQMKGSRLHCQIKWLIKRDIFCSVAVVWENTGSSAPFIVQNLRLHLAKKPCQNQRGHLLEFMTVSEQTSGPDQCYRLIWPTEKVEAYRSSPEGLLLKLAKLVALSLARCAVASEEKNLKSEVWEFKGEENWF